MGRTSTQVKNKWNAKSYDALNIRVKKGEREIIKAYAESQGMSLNAFVIQAIKDKMQ